MNTDTQFVIDALRSSTDVFDDVEQNAAHHRINMVMASGLELGNAARPLPIPQQLGFVYDSILVAEGMIDFYISNKDDQMLLSLLPEGISIYQLIATYRQSIAQLRDLAVQLRQQLK